MRRLAAIPACVALCVAGAGAGSAAHAQAREGAGGLRRVAIIRSYDAGDPPVTVAAPARSRLRLITDYDAGTFDVDPANVLPAVVISAGRPSITRLGLFTTYDGTRAEPLEALTADARPLAIVRDYDPPAAGAGGAVMELPEVAIAAGAVGARGEVELGAIRIER